MGTAVFGAPEFKARSGRTVKVGEDGSLSIDRKRGYLSPEVVMDADEFFQAQRDLATGRWRCPTDPDWVAREVERDAFGRRTVMVFNERTFALHHYNEIVAREVASGETAPHRAARTYLQAHPERKPWERAEPGEVWLFRGEGAPEPQVFLKYRAGWMNASGVVIQNDPVLPYAGSRDETFIPRRIWPEDAS